MFLFFCFCQAIDHRTDQNSISVHFYYLKSNYMEVKTRERITKSREGKKKDIDDCLCQNNPHSSQQIFSFHFLIS